MAIQSKETESKGRQTTWAKLRRGTTGLFFRPSSHHRDGEETTWLPSSTAPTLGRVQLKPLFRLDGRLGLGPWSLGRRPGTLALLGGREAQAPPSNPVDPATLSSKRCRFTAPSGVSVDVCL